MNKGISLTTKIANSQKEKEAHFSIRREVFVREQGIYNDSDQDEFDEKAIPIICKMNDNIVGTVRVFPLSNNTWMGGRLAVLKEFRIYNIGQQLVKEAVKIVKKQRCGKFLAYVQPQNVKFFQRLGWKLTGEGVCINDIIHLVMEADLSGD